MCQRNKYDVIASPGLLQPLPVPEGVWTERCLDLIEELPKSNGKKVIMVVVDRLSKYGRFMALSQPYTFQSLSQCFLGNIFKLHGMSVTLTSDRGPVFLVAFDKNFSHYKVSNYRDQLLTIHKLMVKHRS